MVVAVVVLPGSVVARWAIDGGPARDASPAVTTVPGDGSGASAGPGSSPRIAGNAVAGLPACVDDDLPAEDADPDDWARTILDTAHELPAGYAPPDLESVDEAGFDRDLKVRAEVVDDLAALREAAADAGHPIDVVAAYRSFTLQDDLFRRRSAHLGYAVAITHTARPGHSEHQLGTAIDFKTLGAPTVSSNWGATPAGLWMALNAYRFGFVLSYPEGATDRSCYAFEPWHYRYFGRTLAGRIHASGLTAREFLWREGHPSGA